MAETAETNKPDFRNGFPIRDLGDGSKISGQADGEELVLARRGDEFFAIGAAATAGTQLVARLDLVNRSFLRVGKLHRVG